MDVYLGRQPILDMNQQIIAYEILYRSSTVNSFPDIDANRATLDVLANTFLTMGVEEVSNGKPCFINFTGTLIMENIIGFFNPKNIVIEVLEDVNLTKSIVERLRFLSERGYKIALDDFILQDMYLEVYPELFEFIDYVKIDFLNTPTATRMELETLLQTKYPTITMLAEKVETRRQFEIALHSGYKLFQGYFFEQPVVLTSTDIPANTMQYFQIIAMLKDEEPNINLISASIEVDISLSYKLLQLINKSPKRKRTKVRSIKQAILMIGLADLRKWVYLLAMRELPKHTFNDTYVELMRSSLTRGKLCEKFAQKHHIENCSEYFLSGLFSLIDAILQRPMAQVIARLPLSEELVDTLSGFETQMQPYLQLSIALDKSDFEQIDYWSEQLNITTESLQQMQLEVQQWVNETISEIEV